MANLLQTCIGTMACSPIVCATSCVKAPTVKATTGLTSRSIDVGTGGNRTLSTKELAKIGEPATIQLFYMNSIAEYAKLKEADKHSDVLLDLQ